MSRIELDEIFFNFVSIIEKYVPESDHLEMYVDILSELRDRGYNIQVLHGHDDAVDEAFKELDNNSFDFDDEEEY